MKTVMMDCLNKKDIRSSFLKLGAGYINETNICFAENAGVSKADAFLAGQSFEEGSYYFSKEGLKNLEHEGVYECRDMLTGSRYKTKSLIFGDEDIQSSFYRGIEFGKRINYARTLGNIPGNYLHIDDMVLYIERLSSEIGLDCRILRDKELSELDCNGVLSVNAASPQEAAVAILKIENDAGKAIKGLIGKGVMYDSGGMVLKDMRSMFTMKYDMCGAATILELMEYIKVQNIKVNVVAVIPIVENCIGNSACRPGDVIRMHDGKTVEIYNTDAEGRLILADAISLAVDEGATEIVDLATLTNSCREALGDYVTGVFVTNDEEYISLKKAADDSGELIWRLPIMDVYKEMIQRTDVADLINYAPGEGAGASVAASFLHAFVPESIRWVHLDYVGPAVRKKASDCGAAGATGAMAGSILRLLVKEEK